MRAMKTAASAGGHRAGATRVMETAKGAVLQIDADIDALQPIDAATFAAARLRNVAGPHPAAPDRASACLPADPAAAARPDPCTAADLHRRLLRLGELRARRHDGLFGHARKRRA